MVLMLRHLLLVAQSCGNSLVSPVLLDVVDSQPAGTGLEKQHH